MNINEILEQIDVLVPNDLPPHIKLGFLNQVQNQLYRDYPFADSVMTFNITKGNQFYPMPSNCVDDRAKNLTIDGDEILYYPLFTPVSTDDTAEYWSIVQGSIFVNPVPTGSALAYFYYEKSPKQLTVADIALATVPDLPADFHELYVLGGCSRVAKASPQTIPLVSMYEADFIRLADKADLKLTKKRQTRVLIVNDFV